MKPVIDSVTEQLSRMCESEPLFANHRQYRLPRRQAIISVLLDIRKVIFPGYFVTDDETLVEPPYYIGACLCRIRQILCKLLFS